MVKRRTSSVSRIRPFLINYSGLLIWSGDFMFCQLLSFPLKLVLPLFFRLISNLLLNCFRVNIRQILLHSLFLAHVVFKRFLSFLDLLFFFEFLHPFTLYFWSNYILILFRVINSIFHLAIR